MLIYNTTYIVDTDVVENFKIWITERFIPAVTQEGSLASPRLLRVLSHREAGSDAYSLQWEVAESRVLHTWHLKQGRGLDEELRQVFGDKVVCIQTLLEVMNE